MGAASPPRVFTWDGDSEVALDLEPSGTEVLYRVDGKVTDENTALVVEPPRKLSYTFRPVFGEYAKQPASRVTFTIEQLGDVVRLDMVHEDFPPHSQVFVACSQGWPPILSGLKTLLETQNPVVSES